MLFDDIKGNCHLTRGRMTYISKFECSQCIAKCQLHTDESVCSMMTKKCGFIPVFLRYFHSPKPLLALKVVATIRKSSYTSIFGSRFEPQTTFVLKSSHNHKYPSWICAKAIDAAHSVGTSLKTCPESNLSISSLSKALTWVLLYMIQSWFLGLRSTLVQSDASWCSCQLKGRQTWF